MRIQLFSSEPNIEVQFLIPIFSFAFVQQHDTAKFADTPKHRWRDRDAVRKRVKSLGHGKTWFIVKENCLPLLFSIDIIPIYVFNKSKNLTTDTVLFSCPSNEIQIGIQKQIKSNPPCSVYYIISGILGGSIKSGRPF